MATSMQQRGGRAQLSRLSLVMVGHGGVLCACPGAQRLRHSMPRAGHPLSSRRGRNSDKTQGAGHRAAHAPPPAQHAAGGPSSEQQAWPQLRQGTGSGAQSSLRSPTCPACLGWACRERAELGCAAHVGPHTHNTTSQPPTCPACHRWARRTTARGRP